MFSIVKKKIKSYLKELNAIDANQRINDRIEKFSKMGVWQ